MHVLSILLGLATSAFAISLKAASSGGNASSPLSYGLMFEDINHSGDGGLYAELISNRAFQALSYANATLKPWYGTGGATLQLQTDKPLSKALPIGVKVNLPATVKKDSKVGIVNPGYWGIDVQPQPYTGFFWVRGAYNGSFTASLFSNLTGKVFASTTIPSKINGTAWTRHNYTLTPSVAAPNSNNTFSLTFDPAGLESGATSLDFNLISLFPPTYKDRPNGMRKDLMEALEATKPSFLRFPGGNNLEGQDSPYYWKWNQTIGPLIQRPGRPGTWGYFNTDGLGLAEYLYWCEDLAIEPILAVWSGFYLDGTAVSKGALQPYIQEALDMLEYVLGDPKTTKLGALRASHGRTQPWTVKYVEIGNEDNLNGGYE
jgi:alpha-N-arabinofuranosidase